MGLIKALKAFFRILFVVVAFIFRPRLLVFLFKFFSIVAILVFILAYYQGFQAYRLLHKQYQIGRIQSTECGYEYMGKETGIQHLYDALMDPENPLQERYEKAMSYVLYVIALLSISVLSVTLYYLTNDADKPSFRRDALNVTWVNITKMGLYLRYILIPAIGAIGLLLLYNSKKQLYFPDFKAELKQKEGGESTETSIEDPVLKKKKTKELDRSIDETIKRQWLTPGFMIIILIVITRFYVPDIPISGALFFTVLLITILSALILTRFTRFFGSLQLILHTKYMDSITGLNESASQMVAIPEFRDYIVRNAKRVEKYSDEPFNENQVERLKAEQKLHYYLQHHATRNDELEFMTQVERGKTRSNKILTWSPVVNRIRANLNTTREADEAVNELFKKSNTQMFLIFMMPIFVLIYVGFHVQYRLSEGTTIGMIVVLLLLVFFLVYLNNLKSLVRPKDPETEVHVIKK